MKQHLVGFILCSILCLLNIPFVLTLGNIINVVAMLACGVGAIIELIRAVSLYGK